MSLSISLPIGIDTQSALTGNRQSLNTFSSYYFERDIQTPAASFRFTAPGVDIATRLSIRSGDRAELYIPASGNAGKVQLGCGFIDETNTSISADSVEYQISGRDTLSQLVDNDSVDKNNVMIFVQSISLPAMIQQFLQNTRISTVAVINQGMPTGNFLLQTNVGETKINSIQRFLEYANCLIWTKPAGQIVVGKPNMSSAPVCGTFWCLVSSPQANNVTNMRVSRNVNQAIRQIAVQMQDLSFTNPADITLQNQNPDVLALAAANPLIGKSKYNTYSLGSGMDTLNILGFVTGGVAGGNRLTSIARAYAARALAEENMKTLAVSVTVNGHVNSSGLPYNIDQVYNVYCEDENLYQSMYVHKCVYEMTEEKGMTTSMELCPLGTIVADVSQIGSQ